MRPLTDKQADAIEAIDPAAPARVAVERAVVVRGATADGRPAVFIPVVRAREERRTA